MRRSRLEAWVEAGLISAQQATAIQAFEARRPERPWALYGVAGIGVTAVITGIISLVAAKWESIPDGIKIASYLIGQGGVGVALGRRASRPGLLREVLLTLFALLFLAGIGLIGQIYNLRSDGWQALLFWLGLSLPVTLLAQSRFIGHAWLGGLTLATVIWLNAAAGSDEDLRVLAAMTLAFIVLGIGLFRTPRPWLPPLLGRAAVEWGLVATVGVFPAVASFAWAGDGMKLRVPSTMAVIPWLGAGVAVAAACLAVPPYEARLRRAVAAMIGLAVAYATLPVMWPMHDRDVLGALGFIAIWAAAGAAAVFAGKKRLFDLVAFVIAARFVVVYFEVFGSLAATGIGLILSGGVILGTVYVWHRYRGRLATWVGDLP